MISVVVEQIWSLFQFRGANPCESLKLHIVFSDFNISLLLMFDKNIPLVCNIIKHYIALIFFVLCVFLYLADFVPDFVLD